MLRPDGLVLRMARREWAKRRRRRADGASQAVHMAAQLPVLPWQDSEIRAQRRATEADVAPLDSGQRCDGRPGLCSGEGACPGELLRTRREGAQ